MRTIVFGGSIRATPILGPMNPKRVHGLTCLKGLEWYRVYPRALLTSYVVLHVAVCVCKAWSTVCLGETPHRSGCVSGALGCGVTIRSSEHCKNY